MRKRLVPLLFIFSGFSSSFAQDLDPRAYVRIPVNGTVLITGFAYATGQVVTDPSVPLTDLKATVSTPSIGIARTFGLFKKTAQAFVALPYSWADASANVNGQRETASRTGMSDMRFRFSILLKGAPARTLAEMRKAENKTVIGASLTTIIPTGQYFPDKLINLGTNRWGLKPEIALSQPFGNRWLLDVYTGVWLFTNNHSFYPGNTLRKQDPLGAIQAHLSYNVNLRMWVALNTTYYAGGNSSWNGVGKADRQSNSRIGLTFVVPTGKTSSLKMAASTGAIIRAGADFTIYSIGWQKSFYKMPRKG